MATGIVQIIAAVAGIILLIFGKKIWIAVLQWWQDIANKSEHEKLVKDDEELNNKLNQELDKLKNARDDQ